MVTELNKKFKLIQDDPENEADTIGETETDKSRGVETDQSANEENPKSPGQRKTNQPMRRILNRLWRIPRIPMRKINTPSYIS